MNEEDEDKDEKQEKRNTEKRLPTFPDSFPLLQELDIKLLQEDDRDLRSPSFRAPNLRKLSVRTFGYGGNFQSQFLEDATLSFVTSTTALDYLKDIPAGTGCKVHLTDLFTLDFGDDDDDDDEFDDDLPPVVSPLRTLTITAAADFNDPDGALLKVINSLTLPNVERLEIVSHVASCSNFPVEQLVSMLQRPSKSSPSFSSSLVHLNIGRYLISDDELLKIVKNTPVLTSLVVKEAPRGLESEDGDDYPLTEDFFSGLEGSSEDGGKDRVVLVPNLTQMELEMQSEKHPWDALYLFLESRRRGPEDSSPTLKVEMSVKDSEWDRVRGVWEKRIEELGVDGVEVKVIPRHQKKVVEQR